MIKGFSIRQPWAWTIAAGLSRIDNRTWKPSYRGPLAIHASRMIETSAFPIVERLSGKAVPWNLATGAIIAVARLADVLEVSTDPWFTGPYGWLFDHVVPIPPIACIGHQHSLFPLSADIANAVLRAWWRHPSVKRPRVS